MKYKNYYKVLELRGPRASDDEIKSSYHRLAKAYHPDISPQDVEKFKEINEAYQVLGDKKAKKKYNLRYRVHTLQNINFDEGITELVGIFIGKDDESISPANENTIENLDDVITLSLTSEDIKNGMIKEVNYILPDGKSKKISIKVPVDSKNGTQIKIKGEGRQLENTNKKGDLYVKIDVINVDVNINL